MNDRRNHDSHNGSHVCSECQSCSKQARVNGNTVSVSVWCLWWCLWLWSWCVCACVVYTLKNSVCPLTTSACVPAPRAHVETHVRVVLVHTGTFWTDTGGFSACHTHHTPNTTATQRDTERARKKTEKEEREETTRGGSIEHLLSIVSAFRSL